MSIGKPTIHTHNAHAYLRQLAHAVDWGYRMTDYARSIGCVVRGDEIEANAEQAELLDAWWRARHAGH